MQHSHYEKIKLIHDNFIAVKIALKFRNKTQESRKISITITVYIEVSLSILLTSASSDNYFSSYSSELDDILEVDLPMNANKVFLAQNEIDFLF